MPMKRFEQSDSLLARIDASVEAVRKVTSFEPEIAVILGTGLGNLAGKVDEEAALAYGEIPHFPVSTVESHAGRLAFGRLAGRPVVVMEGRFHCYEGYAPDEVAYPVRVMKQLGARSLVISNAAGGLNPAFAKGDIMIIEDHINFMGLNPLIGPNDERIGPRFPDMCEPYSARLAGLALEAGRREKMTLRRGVYIGVSGPNLETRAEYRMMRAWGADAVGMSTVPEVIAAVHAGMEVLGLSVITDLCDPEHLAPVDIREIIRTASEAGPRLDRLVESFLAAV